MTKMKPTAQQQAILNELTNGRGHVLIRARAGSGKTTAIMMAVDAIRSAHPRTEIAVCAFNKAIADEIRVKLEKAGHRDWRLTQAATLHSMGFGLLRFAFKPVIDDKKVRKIIRRNADRVDNGGRVPSYVWSEFEQAIEKMVVVAKQAGVGFFDDSPVGDKGVWYRLADHFDINGFDDTTALDVVVEAAQQVYMQSLRDTATIDFDDMILFPLVKNMRVRFQKDVIFVDEAQDLSRSRQALVRKFIKPSGRLIIVGDDRQAIYGFSGADSEALENLRTSLRAKVLPLSVTWRCPASVVSLAQTIVPDIEAAPGATEGRVDQIWTLPEGMGPETAILCRNTAPLIDIAYKLIRSGTPCKVEGRDIGEGLKALAKRWKVRNIDALMNRVEDYRERELQKARAKDREDKMQAIEDKCDTLLAICNECIQRELTRVEDVVNFIDDLFADGNENVTTLATYHRSKGREWNRVILVEHTERCPSKFARQEWQLEQEGNLAYVAFTRAMEELLFFEPMS